MANKRYRTTYALSKWFGIDDLSKLALVEGVAEYFGTDVSSMETITIEGEEVSFEATLTTEERLDLVRKHHNYEPVSMFVIVESCCNHFVGLVRTEAEAKIMVEEDTSLSYFVRQV
jgi:hypothetical protein